MNTVNTLEMWAGVECTVNRVGDHYFDQLEMNGHAQRISDLDLFAALGVRTLRYPILWERVAPHGIARADWSWADERLNRLRELGIRPIVGLLHHGSGPRDTSLLDDAFPEKLAAYARAVAERYPWVDAYTPVNEPLTTARFSGLYDCWYPHAQSDLGFMRVLLNQCRAVVLAMRAIRAVNPQAQLVQTEDLGKTYSTPLLAYQAAFDNERRWLTFDLLCGRVNREHPLWDYGMWAGVSEADFAFFLEQPCAPDVFGINHYVTSERFLDEWLAHYPRDTHGGNGKHRYADVEAVRVRAQTLSGPRGLLREVWQRYGLPISVTEAHIGCTREEQLRWLWEVWQSAQALRQEGVDVRAVTAWALLGTFDWDSLVTRHDGHYESGVFDVRAPQPRPTALAQLVRALATQQVYDHPTLEVPGWWRRDDRVLYTPPVERGAAKWRTLHIAKPSARMLLINGATGTLGKAFARACERRGLPHRLLTRNDMDIADPTSVQRALDDLRPWALINTAGYVRVDEAERDAERCYRENTVGPAVLAGACAQRHIPLMTFSSDLVFDGARGNPYVESNRVGPLNVYGRSKAEAEAQVLEVLPSALIVRTSAFFSPWDAHNFIIHALRTLAAGRTFAAAEDVVVSPTYVPDLVQASLDLLVDGERGIWHLTNRSAVTWAALARRAAELSGFDAEQVRARPNWALGWLAPRPRYSALSSERGLMLPSLEDALDRYVYESHRAGYALADAPLARAA